MVRLVRSLSRWFSETIGHALGNPREEQAHLPPAVGVQPFTGRIQHRH